jgi:methylmalonyl-CoA/ethylmalonyl-CoA epimerase
MFKKLLHIGIAVKDLSSSVALFSGLLNTKDVRQETVPDQKVNIAFFDVGDTHIELTEATAPDSPIAKFIEKRGEGVHHLSFEVNDIRAELRRLEQAGFQLIDKEPKLGADGCWVAFIHPKSTNGVLVEISQKALT